ncbi:MAG: LysE family translocator [Cobetia sp.]|jgi:threonine/homoserine/homoserine lactone efflux protein|uniref:LysE family translocator n=1 Tax=Cobetia amphilecti TaxID=1055104 RepID=A0AAP4TWX2_9GAMM|nr:MULTISPECIES: LysE family translocator [Cobetia]AVV33278.1 LysE family translocator [Halomonas sp. SF2003]TCJ25370.1 LysE family translocator [Halomonas sp. GDM18]UTV87492.1 LysE family translocator [Cobetia litoralis]KPM81865.1 threonine transporter [Cobetia sp. UCD-24C]MBF07339.1 LysE family translocator [Cobetia sp.]|tara:strand:- start:68229 stop:68846 length:618 start_codon:yes stop_codon:yes gene_type:complete
MTFESGLTFFIAIFLFGITPGPGILALLARGMSQGGNACVPMAVGMSLSDVCYMLAAVFGLSALATHWGEVFVVIRILGAAYLLYLGYKLWTSSPTLDETDVPRLRGNWWKGFLQGFLISASNPKVILFYIAFLPTFMDITRLSGSDIVIAAGLNLSALLLGVVPVGYLAGRVRRYLRSAKAVKRLNRSAGGLMIGAGGYLALRG